MFNPVNNNLSSQNSYTIIQDNHFRSQKIVADFLNQFNGDIPEELKNHLTIISGYEEYESLFDSSISETLIKLVENGIINEEFLNTFTNNK